MAPLGTISLLLRFNALLKDTHGSGVGTLVGDCVGIRLGGGVSFLNGDG